MHLVQYPHTSSLYSIRVLLGRTTYVVDDADCAISARLEPLLDPCTFGAHYLCRRLFSLCNLRTPRAFTRPVCFWRARLVPPMMQLVQSPNASGLYSTLVFLADTICATHYCSLCSLRTPRTFRRDQDYLGRHKLCRRCCSLCNLPTPRALLDQGFPGRHELCHQCCLCRLRTPRGFTRPGFSWEE